MNIAISPADVPFFGFAASAEWSKAKAFHFLEVHTCKPEIICENTRIRAICA
jgi:hypothetical protein